MLQQAIWSFQGQPLGITGNAYYNEAVSALTTLGLSPTQSASNYDFGGFGVEILEMYTVSGNNQLSAQNQLVLNTEGINQPHGQYVPITVPDGGMTAMLLSGALLCVQGLRRKLAA